MSYIGSGKDVAYGEEKAGHHFLFAGPMDKRHILDEIRRTTEANDGIPLGRQRFLTETGIRESDWIGRFWTKWSDAIREAGYEPNTKQASLEAEALLEKLALLVRDLGHFPGSAELQMKARADSRFPGKHTFSRFGGRADVASALLTWCQKSAGWEDVQAICAPLAVVAPAARSRRADDAPVQTGYVYLLKSGKYYKIGRSDAPGRKESEAAVRLPERVVTAHTIKTDDPAGIERYWQQRFSDRRRTGDWLELRAADVSAFRRRRFM